MPVFKPSPQSYASVEQAVAALRYIRRASEEVEKFLLASGECPPWVAERLLSAATSMGMALQYMTKLPPPKPKVPTRTRKPRRRDDDR